MNDKVKPLSWDSNFFNLKIGRINLDEHLNAEKIIPFLSASNFDLIYVFCQSAIPALNSSLIEKKMDFIINLNEISIATDGNEVSSFSIEEDDFEDIKKLALLSGRYSRFNLDEKFEKDNFKKFYDQWIYNSVFENYVEKIFVSKANDGEIIAFVTLKKINNQMLSINLISVNSKFQGRGLGSKLIKQSFNYAKNQGFTNMVVSTQAIN